LTCRDEAAERDGSAAAISPPSGNESRPMKIDTTGERRLGCVMNCSGNAGTLLLRHHRFAVWMAEC
jgi:hypothetical protein